MNELFVTGVISRKLTPMILFHQENCDLFIIGLLIQKPWEGVGMKYILRDITNPLKEHQVTTEGTLEYFLCPYDENKVFVTTNVPLECMHCHSLFGIVEKTLT